MRKRVGSACHDVSFFPLEEGQPPGLVEDITHIVFACGYQNDNFDSDTPITRSVIDGNRRRANASNTMFTHSGTPQPICASTESVQAARSAPAPTALGRRNLDEIRLLPNLDEIPSQPCDEDESCDNVPVGKKHGHDTCCQK